MLLFYSGANIQPQGTITRAESAFALGTVIVGPFQVERAEHAFECFLVTAMILGRCSAGARQLRARMIAGVGIQPLFQCSRGQPQSLPPRRRLHRFEIQIANRLAA
jgi:hypothetical protein